MTLAAEVSHAKSDQLFRTFLRATMLSKSTGKPNESMEALVSLDLDGSGNIEPSEIEAFAKKIGLKHEDAAEEFRGLDENGDGKLDLHEVSRVLDTEAEVPAQAPSQPVLAAISSNGGTETTASVSAASLSSLDSQKIELSNTEAAAGLQAGRLLATTFAQKAALALKDQKQTEDAAVKLEEIAKSLRGRAQELAQKAADEAMKAAKQAASEIMKHEESHLKELEDKATEAAKKAAERRNKAKIAMEQVMLKQAEVSQKVRLLHEQVKENGGM